MTFASVFVIIHVAEGVEEQGSSPGSQFGNGGDPVASPAVRRVWLRRTARAKVNMNSRYRSSAHPIQRPLPELLQLGEPAIEAAVREDLALGDPTTEAVFSDDTLGRGVLIAKERGRIAGLPVAERVFRLVDPNVQFDALVDDGEIVAPGDVVAEVVGPLRAILAAERTALNFVQRMSGIATTTAAYVRATATTKAEILDTRKTVPGLRALDKIAVRLGGGTNHRFSLSEMAMVKDTHVAAAGGIRRAVEAIRRHAPTLPLEVEVRSLDELDELLAVDPLPERILLDNLAPDALREAVRRVAGRAVTEASGGITLETIGEVAASGVDAVSVGALTHSVRALDVSLELRATERPEPEQPGDAGDAIRRRLGGRIVVLAHHYTRDEVVARADIVGDSLALARAAATQDADTIVFCGVRFMGETAAILCRPDQRVVMPTPSAGCFLADCTDLESIEQAWRDLGERIDTNTVIPVTYVNSSAALKAFCGRHGGTVCTSSNAHDVLRWALDRAHRVFFFPDQHLATNTAVALGVAAERIVRWNASRAPARDAIAAARVIAWPGACDVHRRFRVHHVERVRSECPDAFLIVHPECGTEIVERADASGSTAEIVRRVEEAGPGATIAIGTEARLVRRLQRRHLDRRIVCLSDVPPFCPTMAETTLADLRETLAEIEGNAVEARHISVDRQTAADARQALERMLDLTAE